MTALQLLIFITWSFFPFLGDDYDNYLVLLSRPELAIEFNIEPIPLIFIFLINQMGLSEVWFFVGHASILCLYLHKIHVLINDNFLLRESTKVFLFFLLVLLFIGPGISIVRQSVATVILTYAILKWIFYTSKYENWLFFGSTVLAMSFHYSALLIALIFIGIGLASKTRLRSVFMFVNVFAIVVFVLLSSEVVRVSSSENIYSSHLGVRASLGKVSLIFYLTIIVYFLVALLMIINISKLAISTGMGVVFFCINIVLLGGGVKIIALDYVIFNRLVFYFNPFLLIGLCLIVEHVKQRYILYFLGLIFMTLLFFLIILKRGYI